MNEKVRLNQSILQTLDLSKSFGGLKAVNGVNLDEGVGVSSFTEGWSFIMGILFMAAVLGFRSGLIGILGKRLKLDI